MGEITCKMGAAIQQALCTRTKRMSNGFSNTEDIDEITALWKNSWKASRVKN
jgi:hypothetical protein